MFNDEDEFISSRKKIENLPVYVKAREIYHTVRQITDLIPDEDEFLSEIKAIILEDAMIIPAKIAGAEGGDLYDIRMENAAIIRKAANDLKIQNHNLEMFGFEHVDYYKIVRKQIDEFRLLFIDWVAGFDKTNYIVDRWGLFNPPGVGPFDKE